MSTDNNTSSYYYSSNNYASNIVPNPEFSQATSTPRSRPRFGYYAPPSYPRPRSSASKPNPHYTSGYGEDNMYPDDQSYLSESGNSSFATCTEYLSDQSFNVSSSGGQGTSSGAAKSVNAGLNVKQWQPQQHPGIQQIFNALIQGANRGESQKGKRFARKRKAPASIQPHKRCDLCNLDFTSQIPLDMHLRGAKHMKKMKAMEILKTLESEARETTQTTVRFHCEVCDVTLNSAIQLQMHYDGTKHKNKVNVATAIDVGNKTECGKKTDGSEQNGKNAAEPVSQMYHCELCGIIANSEEMLELHYNGAKHKNKLANKPKNIGIAEGQIPAAIPAKKPKFGCDICGITVNSDVQLQQHLQSKRHEAKLTGQPLNKKQKKSDTSMIKPSEVVDKVNVVPPLSMTFVQPHKDVKEEEKNEPSSL